MPIIIESGKDWFLRSSVQGTDWGPFETEDAAWRHLFGRESTVEERVNHGDAGWSVFQALLASDLKGAGSVPDGLESDSVMGASSKDSPLAATLSEPKPEKQE